MIMTRKRTIVKKTSESNVPVLKSSSYCIDNGSIVFTYEDKCAGIFDPFEGIFLVKVTAIPSVGSRMDVMIDNIYGEARKLYHGGFENGSPAIVPVAVDEWTIGMHLCYFDTNERRLYMIQ